MCVDYIKDISTLCKISLLFHVFQIIHNPPYEWTYKIRRKGEGTKLVCTWHCQRAEEKRQEIIKESAGKVNRIRLTDDQKMTAVSMAVAGEDPRPFLLECGSKNVDALWGSIRLWIQGRDPELAEKLPKVIGHKSKKPAETPEGTAAEPPRPAPVEATKATIAAGPYRIGNLIVREVEGEFGRYRRTDVSEKIYIDFEPSQDLDVQSYMTDQWKAQREEQEIAFGVLGVAL